MFGRKPPSRIRIDKENLANWPSFQRLLKDGKVKFDSNGRLRYLHGAPVGDMLLARVDEDGSPVYRESAEEWFDADSDNARSFRWQ